MSITSLLDMTVCLMCNGSGMIGNKVCQHCKGAGEPPLIIKKKHIKKRNIECEVLIVEETTEEYMPCAWCGCGLIPVSEGFCSIECFKENEAANRE